MNAAAARWRESGSRSPQLILLLALLSYASFLALPGFVDMVRGDGTQILAPGYGWVLFGFLHLPPTLLDMLELRFVDFVIVPFCLANLAFIALPGLHLTGHARRPRLNQVLRWVFLAGAGGFATMLWQTRFTPPAWPAYFWLVAVVAALRYLQLAREPAQLTPP